MQSPMRNTPVSKCLDLASHSVCMFGKFSSHPAFVALEEKMSAGAAELAAAQAEYEKAVKAILPRRVDIKYENYLSDRRIRLSQQKIEIADSKRNGRIASLVFPEGSAPITRLVGPSQVEAMINLEGRLAAAQSLWSEAEAEKVEISAFRQRYQAALENRQNAVQKARDLRAARNAAKDKFLTMYAEVMARVQAELPRDKVTQELFFDEVRTRSALAIADTDEGDEASSETTEGQAQGA
ncbi:hypothetical protein [Polyangium jinanense]|uniref:Uncharacterized protein n=1 Tax=Polyangium jinanense TaxID=2829994 RepID=A0A9X3XD87_9BACT|nr:hypothetical protein [Polyangium jinanense]MDC3957008.1 hypothetical protein [Polyangium jinanense]MDC3987165.1 hypothetical protein [Polyangium jinanense]